MNRCVLLTSPEHGFLIVMLSLAVPQLEKSMYEPLCSAYFP